MIGRRLSAASHTDFTDSNPTQQKTDIEERKNQYIIEIFLKQHEKNILR